MSALNDAMNEMQLSALAQASGNPSIRGKFSVGAQKLVAIIAIGAGALASGQVSAQSYNDQYNRPTSNCVRAGSQMGSNIGGAFGNDLRFNGPYSQTRHAASTTIISALVGIASSKVASVACSDDSQQQRRDESQSQRRDDSRRYGSQDEYSQSNNDGGRYVNNNSGRSSNSYRSMSQHEIEELDRMVFELENSKREMYRSLLSLDKATNDRMNIQNGIGSKSDFEQKTYSFNEKRAIFSQVIWKLGTQEGGGSDVSRYAPISASYAVIPTKVQGGTTVFIQRLTELENRLQHESADYLAVVTKAERNDDQINSRRVQIASLKNY